MSITTNAEAQAVHTLLSYLVPRAVNGITCQPSSDEARDAAGLLARSAHAKLMAGPHPDLIAFHWNNGVLPTIRDQL